MPSTTEQRLRGPARVVAEALDGVRPLVWMWRDGLTVIALESRQRDRRADYIGLEEAVNRGGLEVHEAPIQSVPTVEAVTGPAPVLLLGGDTIVGGAQNRIINVSILLKASATTAIPVSCLELGRWNDGHAFSAGRAVDYGMRRMVEQQVHANVANVVAGSRFIADQGAIWHEINERQARAKVTSATAALHDVYRAEDRALADFQGAFPMPAGARGVAIGLFDRLIGLDLFDSTETLERQWSRLVQSAASALLDARRAVDAGVLPAPAHRRLHSAALRRILERAGQAVEHASVHRSVGLGSDVRFAGPKVIGSALVHDRRAVHVALFRPG